MGAGERKLVRPKGSAPLSPSVCSGSEPGGFLFPTPLLWSLGQLLAGTGQRVGGSLRGLLRIPSSNIVFSVGMATLHPHPHPTHPVRRQPAQQSLPESCIRSPPSGAGTWGLKSRRRDLTILSMHLAFQAQPAAWALILCPLGGKMMSARSSVVSWRRNRHLHMLTFALGAPDIWNHPPSVVLLLGQVVAKQARE